jgi:hypothetical protein
MGRWSLAVDAFRLERRVPRRESGWSLVDRWARRVLVDDGIVAVFVEVAGREGCVALWCCIVVGVVFISSKVNDVGRDNRNSFL